MDINGVLKQANAMKDSLSMQARLTALIESNNMVKEHIKAGSKLTPQEAVSMSKEYYKEFEPMFLGTVFQINSK